MIFTLKFLKKDVTLKSLVKVRANNVFVQTAGLLEMKHARRNCSLLLYVNLRLLIEAKLCSTFGIYRKNRACEVTVLFSF